jgi:hypothetical protein
MEAPVSKNKRQLIPGRKSRLKGVRPLAARARGREEFEARPFPSAGETLPPSPSWELPVPPLWGQKTKAAEPFEGFGRLFLSIDHGLLFTSCGLRALSGLKDRVVGRHQKSGLPPTGISGFSPH